MRRLVLIAVLVAAAAAGPASSESQRFAGTIAFEVTLATEYGPVACPSGVPQDETGCSERTGQGTERGLGLVRAAYTLPVRVGPPTCPVDLNKPLATTMQLVVEGKGEIALALADGTNCVDLDLVRNEPQAFTVTGGTGVFVGASGSGKVARSLLAGAGTETWTGTLVAPGHEFDLTPPAFSGATSRTVTAPKGAKSARVTFKVTATDNADGSVPAVCSPKSGSRFRIGRTTVRCEATDSSANTGKAAFTVTVKARR